MTFDLSDLSDQALSELLLDYVQGTASQDAVAAIEARLPIDPKIADEIAYYKGLKNAVSPLKQFSAPDELGWKRLSKAVEAERKSVAANDNFQFWKYAAAALAIVAALQTAFLVQSPRTLEEPVFVTASAENEAAFGLTVIFQPNATADDLAQALNAVDGEIIAGPSALGLFTVAFDTEASRDSALEALAAQTDVIESVTLN
ncbi:MAG: hypothetical protein AAFV59_10375 [Pseudomonadota bacterium]